VETAIDIFVNVFLAESEWYVWFSGPNPKSKYDVEFAYYGLYDFDTILNNRCRHLTVYKLFNAINNSDYDRITTAIVYIFFSEYATIYARTKPVDYEPDEDFIPDDIDADEWYESTYQPALNVWRAYIASMDLVNNKKLLKKSTYLLLNKFPDCIRTLNDGIDLYWTYMFQ
jgi:hypothetical protein